MSVDYLGRKTSLINCILLFISCLFLWSPAPATALNKDTGTLSSTLRLRSRVPVNLNLHKRDHSNRHTRANHGKKCSPYDWSRRRCNSVTGCVWCSPRPAGAVAVASTCVSTEAANKLTASREGEQSYTCDTTTTDSLMKDFGLRRRDSVTLIKVAKQSKKSNDSPSTASMSVVPDVVPVSASPTGGRQ